MNIYIKYISKFYNIFKKLRSICSNDTKKINDIMTYLEKAKKYVDTYILFLMTLIIISTVVHIDKYFLFYQMIVIKLESIIFSLV